MSLQSNPFGDSVDHPISPASSSSTLSDKPNSRRSVSSSHHSFRRSPQSPRKRYNNRVQDDALSHFKLIGGSPEQTESPNRLAAKYRNWTPQHLSAHIKSSLTFRPIEDTSFSNDVVNGTSRWIVQEQLGGKAFFDLCEEDIEELGIPLDWKHVLLYIWLDLHQLPKYGSPRAPTRQRRSALPFRSPSSTIAASRSPLGLKEVRHCKSFSKTSFSSDTSATDSIASEFSTGSTLIGGSDESEATINPRYPINTRIESDGPADEESDSDLPPYSDFVPRALFQSGQSESATSTTLKAMDLNLVSNSEVQELEWVSPVSAFEAQKTPTEESCLSQHAVVDEGDALHAEACTSLNASSRIFSSRFEGADVKATSDEGSTSDEGCGKTVDHAPMPEEAQQDDKSEISNVCSSRRVSIDSFFPTVASNYHFEEGSSKGVGEKTYSTTSSNDEEVRKAKESLLQTAAKIDEALQSSTQAISSLSSRVDQLEHSVTRLERLCASTVIEREESTRTELNAIYKSWHQQFTPYAVLLGWTIAVAAAHIARSRAAS